VMVGEPKFAKSLSDQHIAAPLDIRHHVEVVLTVARQD